MRRSPAASDGNVIVARPRTAAASHEHAGLHSVRTEPVQGFLARVRQVARFDQFHLTTSKRGSAQANWVALTNIGRCHNSSGDDFAYDLILASVGK
jgi:hypothetical protein